MLPAWSAANVLPKCPEYYVELSSNQEKTVYSPNYLPSGYGFPVQTACEFTVAAPIYHQISMYCNFYVGVNCNDFPIWQKKKNKRKAWTCQCFNKTFSFSLLLSWMCIFDQNETDCTVNDSFWVQLDGTRRLNSAYAKRYCGANKVLQETSTFNSITLGAYENLRYFASLFK